MSDKRVETQKKKYPMSVAKHNNANVYPHAVTQRVPGYSYLAIQEEV